MEGSCTASRPIEKEPTIDRAFFKQQLPVGLLTLHFQDSCPFLLKETDPAHGHFGRPVEARRWLR